MRNSHLFVPLVLATILIAQPCSRAQTVPEGGAAAAPKLVAVLQSNAPQKEKVDALRQLAVVGTRDALPALLPLLADDNYSHMARYALQTMPDPAVDEGLRKALPTLKGRQLVGVIHTLGARRDAKAVKPLAALLRDADPDVAQGAARALGSIGTRDAGRILADATPKASPANQLAFCEGTLRAAEQLVEAGDTRLALRLYEALRGLSTAPHQVRTAVLRGVALADPKKAPALIAAAMTSSDAVQFNAGIRTALEIPGPAVTSALAKNVERVGDDRQIVIIQTLGRRGDPEALPTLAALARSPRKPVRLAALRALPELNRPEAATVFTGLLADADTDVAQAAQEGLAALPGANVDQLVIKMLGSTDARQRAVALELVGRRRMADALPTLLKLATDPDGKVRSTALRRVGELGGPSDIGALLELVSRARENQYLDAAAQALSAIAGRVTDPAAVAGPVIARLPNSPVPQKNAFLEILAVAGGPDAFRAVRSAADDSEAAVRTTALRALAGWKSAEAAPELLALARRSTETTERLLCLRGCFSWASSAELPAPQRLAMCREAAGLVQSADEKKLFLGALGSVRVPETLELVTPHLADAAIKEEAAAAIAAIADDLVKLNPKPAALLPALEKAAQATENADLGKRLTALKRQAGG